MLQRVIALGALVVANLAAAPSTSDLWDQSQAGFLLTTTPGLTCGFGGNLFGASLGNGGGLCSLEGTERLVLSEASGGVHTFEWTTASMNLTSFELNYSSDGAASVLRLLGRLQLAVFDGTNYVEFYDSGVNGFPAAAPGSLNQAVAATGSQWRATFTNRTDSSPFSGSRLIELDGYGTLVDNGVPEPGTAGLALFGLVAAIAARKQTGR